MGRVDCFKLSALLCWFNSNDHLPHHIHVQKGRDWEIRVYFLRSTKKTLSFDIKWQSTKHGPTAKDIKEILAAVLEHREQLLDEWQLKVKRGIQDDDS